MIWTRGLAFCGPALGSVFLLSYTGMTQNLCNVRPPDNIVPTLEHKSNTCRCSIADTQRSNEVEECPQFYGKLPNLVLVGSKGGDVS
jgi:hypothetical protein